MAELEAREAHFNKVQDRGEALIMDRHPATKTVEVSLFYVWCIDYISALILETLRLY